MAASKNLASKTAGIENAANKTEVDCQTYLWIGEIVC